MRARAPPPPLSRLPTHTHHAFTDAPYEVSLSKPLEKQPAGRAKLRTPCQREKKERKKHTTDNTHPLSPPQSSTLLLILFIFQSIRGTTAALRRLFSFSLRVSLSGRHISSRSISLCHSELGGWGWEGGNRSDTEEKEER